MSKPDLDSKARIRQFIDAFYGELLQDDQLAPIFLDVADIDLDKHLPLIRAYWEKLLLGEQGYHRHTMNIHRRLNARRPLTRADFDRWVALFTRNVDRQFAGPKAERAKRVASQIADNMYKSLSPAEIY